MVEQNQLQQKFQETITQQNLSPRQPDNAVHSYNHSSTGDPKERRRKERKAFSSHYDKNYLPGSSVTIGSVVKIILLTTAMNGKSIQLC